MGLFAGLNVLPKCTAMSTYAYSLDAVHLMRLQQSFVKQAVRLRLYDADLIIWTSTPFPTSGSNPFWRTTGPVPGTKP